MRIRLIAFGLLSGICLLMVHGQALEDSLVADSLPVKPAKPLKLGISLTGSSYRGDLDNAAFNFTRFYPGMNFSMQLDGEKPLRVQFNAGYGQFAEEYDQGSQPPIDTSQAQSVNFQGVVPFVQTSFFYTDLRLRYRIYRTSALELFGGAGVGFLMFSPRDKNGKFLSETNLNRLTGESYNTLVAQFPLNVGMQYTFSRSVAFGLDYTYRLTPSDYLDNVSKLGNKAGNDVLHTLAATVYLSIREVPKLPAIFRDTTEELRPLAAASKIEDVLDAIPGDLEDRDPARQAALYDHPPMQADDPTKIRRMTGFYPNISAVAPKPVALFPAAQAAARDVVQLSFQFIALPETPATWMGNTIEDEAPEFGHTQVVTALTISGQQPAEPQPDAPALPVAPVTVAPAATLPAARTLSPIEEAALKAVANDDVMYYHPKRGDKLSQLSERFQVPIEAIRIANGLPATATAPTLGVFLKLPDLRKYYAPSESNR